MPHTIAAVLVVLIVFLPGILGETVYKRLQGIDWREQEWRSFLRLLGFSFTGLMIYALTADTFHWPAPIHVFPHTILQSQARPELLFALFRTYLGHVTGSIVAGFLAAGGIRTLALLFQQSSAPSTWDKFLRDFVPKHWVIVVLTTGEAYLGVVEAAEHAVGQSERDVILGQPALWNAVERAYIATSHRSIFLPASMIGLLATVIESKVDRRAALHLGNVRTPGDANG